MKGCKLVTLDAQSLYNNINTDHAINILGQWFILHKQDLPVNFFVDLLLSGIELLMINTVFIFRSPYFLQTNGIATGTKVSCMYATIYYSYQKETKLSHLLYIKYYRRLINDTFIIVDENTPFENLEMNMNKIRTNRKTSHLEYKDATYHSQLPQPIHHYPSRRNYHHQNLHETRQLLPLPNTRLHPP